jgi:hypothetical protein
MQFHTTTVKEPLAIYRVHSEGVSREMNLAPAQQKILFSLLEDPSVPNKTKIEERTHELCLQSAIYNWKKSAKLAAKKELKKYLHYNFRHLHLINGFRALLFWVMFTFEYHTLKTIKDKILNPRTQS